MLWLWPARTRVFRPWKNGGGETAEIVAHPPGAGLADFDWRISTARVDQPGPFSDFTGITRTLALLDGPGLELRFDSHRVTLDAASPPLEFDGGAACHGRPLGPGVLDFNVMVRAPWRARVTRAPIPPDPPQAAVMLALLMADWGGHGRLDLVDLTHCPEPAAGALIGAPALLVELNGG